MDEQPVTDEEFLTEIDDMIDLFVADEIETWFDIAADLYEAVLQLEEQLSELGYGLRPFPTRAIRRFEEMTEDAD